jgi:hypothetical protein
VTTYREHQDRALRRARGEDPTPDKSGQGRKVLIGDRKPPAEEPAPAGVASSAGPGPPKVRGLPWIKGMPQLCADCRGPVVTSHAGTAPERACRKCGWRYRFCPRQQAWELIEG